MRHLRKPIIIPPTTDLALVFPFDHENKVFDHGFYSQALTDGRAPTENITHFLKAAEGVLKKKLKCLKFLKIYIALSLSLSFLCMLYLTVQIFSDIDDDLYLQQTNYYTKSSHNSHKSQNSQPTNNAYARSAQYSAEDQLEAVFLGWICIFIACIFWKGVFCLVRKICLKKARKAAKEVVERYNPLFAPYGLRWNIPLAFPHYIELWKDYKGQSLPQGNVQAPHGYMPLANPMQNMQMQPQVQVPVQRYPVLEPVVDVNAYVEFPGNQPGRNMMGNQGQGQNHGGYMPPQYVNYTGNSHYI